jgi:hypothetical protein
MNIQPIKPEAIALPAKAKAAAPAPKPEQDVQPDPAQVERKRQLLEKLGALPETRPEKVAEAEAIVADTTYPSNELMARLARVMSGLE